VVAVTRPEETKRTQVISVRLSPGELVAIERAAARDGRSVGEWIREVARAAAEASK
jgi:uncharacterized protein (DUF1778 family)